MMGKNQNLKRKPLKPREKIVFEKSEYAVVEFIDDRSKLFEGIPELWFVNEERTACYWPPKKGRSFKLRAIDQDTPDWDWDIYECIVVSEGHGIHLFLFLIECFTIRFGLQLLIVLPPVLCEKSARNATIQVVPTTI